MEFPRQEYWSGLPCPPPGDLTNPGIKPMSPALAGGFFTTESPGQSIPHLDLPNFSILLYCGTFVKTIGMLPLTKLQRLFFFSDFISFSTNVTYLF